MKKVFNLLFILFILFLALPVFGQASIQRITRIRDNTTNAMTDVLQLTLNMPTTTWGLTTKSGMYFYEDIGAQWRYWSGTQMNTESIAATLYAPWQGSLNFAYDATSGTWRWVNVVNTHADGLALTLNGLNTASFLYLYNGATMDLWPSTANGGAQVGLEEWHVAFDAANAWVADYKKDIAIYAPAATEDTAVDDSAGGTLGDIVLDSFYALNQPNLTFYIQNTGGGSGDNILHCYVLGSPSGAAGTWSNIDSWNDCDGLASGGGTCHLQLAAQSHAYLKAECICDAGDDTEVTAWVTGNKG